MRIRLEEKRRKGKEDSKGARGDSSGSRAGGEKGVFLEESLCRCLQCGLDSV